MTLTENNVRVADEVLQRLQKFLNPDAEQIPLHAPLFAGNEWTYVKECIDTGWVSSIGKFVDQFEQMLCEFTGSRHCIATGNGTLALHAALLVGGVVRGDEVIVPDLTFAATANAVVHAGAQPVLCDVSSKTMGVDPHSLRNWLQENTERSSRGLINRTSGRRISALVVMHCFGHPADIDDLLAICEENQLQLIEDAAESIGSYYQGTHTGRFGRLGVLSFNGNKTITTGGGGAIITDDADLARYAKHLTTTAKIPHPYRFRHDQVGFNYRMPNINAALGCAQLESLPEYLDRKRQIANRYAVLFSDLPGVTFLTEPAGCKSNYWLNALVLDDDGGDLLQHLLEITNASKIQTRPTWDLMHTLPAFAEIQKAPTPVAERLAKTVLCIPSGPSLWSEQ